MDICPHCSKTFLGQKSLFGHYAQCVSRPKAHDLRYHLTQLHLEAENDYHDNEFDDNFMADGIPPEFSHACMTYFQNTQQFLDMSTLSDLKAGYVKLLNGARDKAAMEIYMDLCNFVIKCKSLSSIEADTMINMVKRISHMNGKEIPLPQRFRTLYRHIVKELNGYKDVVVQTEFDLPAEIFGENPHGSGELRRSKGILTDPLVAIARMLVDPNVVGERNENISFGFEHKRSLDSSTGKYKREFSNFNTGNFYREAERKIHEKHGINVTPLPIGFSTDATLLTRTESKTTTPVYAKPLALNTKTLVTYNGIEVVGFTPEITQNDTILSAILGKRGISGDKKQEEACKVNRKWVEQDYLDRLTESIRLCDETGPILLQVGRGEHKVFKLFMPYFAGFASDNQGSHSAACCLGTGTTFPCRECVVHRDDCSDPNSAETSDLRDVLGMRHILAQSFQAFGRYLRQDLRRKTNLISVEDQSILDFCHNASVFPVFPFFLNIPLPFDGFNPMKYFRCDLLHTSVGLLRNWIFYTYVTLTRVCKEPLFKAVYGEGPSKLDAAISNMPSLLIGCMPYKHVHFRKGVSEYCKSVKSTGKAKLSQSGMSKLDSSQVPSLVLQMLLCLQDTDDIIPDCYEDEDCLGSLKECIMLSGFGLLSVHFELSRFALTSTEIFEGNTLLKVAKLQLYRLLAYKARILNIPGGDSKQIKPHISGHFFEHWIEFACRHIDDTSITESMHRLVKNRWRTGSKRTLEAPSEMFDRLQSRKVVEFAHEEFSKKFGSSLPEYKKKDTTKNSKAVHYVTENGIEFSTTGYKKNSQSLVFAADGNSLRLRKSGTTLNYCSTLLSLAQLLQILKRDPSLVEFLHDLRDKVDGTRLRLLRTVNYNGSSQGIPKCTLHTDKTHHQEYGRFDWVTILQGARNMIVPVQLCCLLEVKHRGISSLWFVAAECVVLNRSKDTHSPFPSCRYKLGAKSEYLFFAEKVDSVNEPAMVIPTSLQKTDYLFQDDLVKRRNTMFTSIPFGFLYRDDWDDGINHGLNDIHKNFKAFPPISRTWNNTDTEYQAIKGTFLRNGVQGRVLTDEDAIEEYDDEPERRRGLWVGLSRFCVKETKLSIGYGLFTKSTIPPNTIITKFIGEIISEREYKRRQELGKGGYGIHLKCNKILDCYDYCLRRECWASFANSPTNLDHNSVYMLHDGIEPWCTLPPQSPCKSNAKLSICGRTVYLKSKENGIPIGHEIMHSYGTSYKYPR